MQDEKTIRRVLKNLYEESRFLKDQIDESLPNDREELYEKSAKLWGKIGALNWVLEEDIMRSDIP